MTLLGYEVVLRASDGQEWRYFAQRTDRDEAIEAARALMKREGGGQGALVSVHPWEEEAA